MQDVRPRSDVFAEPLASLPQGVCRRQQFEGRVPDRAVWDVLELLKHPLEGIPEVWRGVTSAFCELPYRTVANRLAAACELCLSNLEVVVSE